jgi:hypothetical protein
MCARVIDAFVEKLMMSELVFERAQAAETGRPDEYEDLRLCESRGERKLGLGTKESDCLPERC